MSHHIMDFHHSWQSQSWHLQSWLFMAVVQVLFISISLLHSYLNWVYQKSYSLLPLWKYVYVVIHGSSQALTSSNIYLLLNFLTHITQTYLHYILTPLPDINLNCHTYLQFSLKPPSYFTYKKHIINYYSFHTQLCSYNLFHFIILIARPVMNNITQQKEDVSISEEPLRRRVVMHSNTAILAGVRDWRYSLAGKLYDLGIMTWQDAERAAKFIWPHLKRHNRWMVQNNGNGRNC
ncbi:hypothetical protein MKX03_016270 [Papaver bracteatum]|nr:hypothetical protein MKX03_016270 [Papaver bracteatum]